MSIRDLTLLRKLAKATIAELDDYLFMIEECVHDETQRIAYGFEALKECGELLVLLGDVIVALEESLK